jgi:hypothetical protein
LVDGQLFSCNFVWSFNLVEASPEEFYQELTLPTLAALSRFSQEQKALVNLLKGEYT